MGSRLPRSDHSEGKERYESTLAHTRVRAKKLTSQLRRRPPAAVRFRLPTDVEQYLRVVATNDGAGNASGKTPGYVALAPQLGYRRTY